MAQVCAQPNVHKTHNSASRCRRQSSRATSSARSSSAPILTSRHTSSASLCAAAGMLDEGRQSSSAGFSPASRRRTRRNSSAPPAGLVCKPLRRILFDPAFLRRCRRRLDAGRRSSETPAPPELVDDLVREILLRVPPDDPAHLVRAALVCKPWRRILFDPAFLGRYREFHGTPPLLGVFCFEHPSFKFLSTATAPPLPFPVVARWQSREISAPANFRCNWAVDCRHGRVLFYSYHSRAHERLIVWDPITGDERNIPMPDDLSPEIFSAAVLCVADGCNHLDCHGGPFLVVLVGTDEHYVSWVTEFSSETGGWSPLTQVDFSASNRLEPDAYIAMRPSLLVGDAVYFFMEEGKAILKCNLGGRGLSVIDAPDLYDGILMTVVDGELGFVGVEGDGLHLWSWKANNAQGTAAWVHLREINLQTLFSIPDSAPELVGFAEGTDTIFFRRNETIFTLKLKSGQVRNVVPSSGDHPIIPYMSFYTPDLVGVRPPPP